MSVEISNEEKEILDYLMSNLKLFLKENDEFAPFGVILNKDFELIPIAIYPDEMGSKNSTIDSNNLIDNFKKYLISKKDEQDIIAAGIAIDTKISGSDVAWLQIDRRKSAASDFYLEYLKEENGEYHYFDLIISDNSTLDIW